MTKKTQKLVAEICLYGNGGPVGYGWLARLTTGAMLGNGEPRVNYTRTDCVWLACDQIRRLFSMAGGPASRGATVRVFAPGGQLMADCDLRHPPYFGDLKWEAAPQCEFSVEEIMAASAAV